MSHTLIINIAIIFIDVITFPPSSITQSVSVEVMPLMSGFLPIPTLNVFCYYPSNSRQNTGKSMMLNFVIVYIFHFCYFHIFLFSESKMVPFSIGQVYNASKSVQTHVLPRIITDTS